MNRIIKKIQTKGIDTVLLKYPKSNLNTFLMTIKRSSDGIHIERNKN